MSPHYTGKVDDGTTTLYASTQRLDKSESAIEALGTLDELNTVLGLARTTAQQSSAVVGAYTVGDMLLMMQEDLFVAQAQLAGADKELGRQSVYNLDSYIMLLEDGLTVPQSFVIPGTDPVSAWLDYARAVTRRAERSVIRCELQPAPYTLIAYLNRLSSLLYVLARRTAQQTSETELSPSY